MKTFISIDLNALKHNVNFIKRYNPNKLIQAVVKANAYGHGDKEISKHLEKLGINNFAVARVEEGVELRKSEIKGTILVLGGANKEKEFQLAAKYNLDLTIYSLENYKIIEKLIGTLLKKDILSINFTLKIETGMHRLGIVPNDLSYIYKSLLTNKLSVTGFMSHFIDAGTLDSEWSQKQINIFQKYLTDFQKQFRDFKGNIHIENTSGFFNYNLNFTNLARIGIGLYGYGHNKLKPVLKLHSLIKDIKVLKKGETVSYGGQFLAEKDIKVAIIPVGYGDGFPRSRGKGSVLINGKKAKILSVICMDYIMADITTIEAYVNDKVLVIGDIINANYWAIKSNTIPYEITTLLNPRIKRVYIDA